MSIPIPIYDPPYDSPIEDAFAWQATKYLSPKVTLSTQVEVPTICGLFRLDFVAEGANGRRTGFECDGKEFHNERRDEWRDAMILGCSDIHEIYRIPGKEITYRIEDVFYAISVWSPWLSDDRQKHNLIRLARNKVVNQKIKEVQTRFSVNYLDEDTDILNSFFIEKRHKNIPDGRRQFWQSAFQFAQSVGGGNLDEVMSLYDDKFLATAYSSSSV